MLTVLSGQTGLTVWKLNDPRKEIPDDKRPHLGLRLKSRAARGLGIILPSCANQAINVSRIGGGIRGRMVSLLSLDKGGKS